jgi:hypothetical protein
MRDEQFQLIVAEVISRLAPLLGADGHRGPLIIVSSGATAAFGEAVRQARLLVLDGYQVRLVFSPSAEQLCGKAFRDQLAGFPHVDVVEPTGWLSALREARAVVCPLISVNTLSKLSLLIADNPAANLMLHGLFMGKPVLVARDGVDLTSQDRRALGIHEGTPALKQAVTHRLRTVADYGCHVTEVRLLRENVNSVLINDECAKIGLPDGKSDANAQALICSGKLVTAADVRNAHRIGAKLRIASATLITPLARDLAMQRGVVFEESNDWG